MDMRILESRRKSAIAERASDRESSQNMASMVNGGRL